MDIVRKPRVYISYTWRTPGLQEKAVDLADRLRAAGVDSRIDLYYSKSLHGLLPPEGRPGDVRPPWMVWQEDQVREADLVLVLCTREYAESPIQSGAWWDVRFMLDNLEAGAVQRSKFIPAGFGTYGENAEYVPDFLGGANYYNLGAGDGFDDLMRRIRVAFPIQRNGVFISYNHVDEEWLDALLEHVNFLRKRGIGIWTDQEIKPGELWDLEIKGLLARAKVAVLLVTPAFFNSTYIANNELPQLLEAARSEGLVVFWIPVRDSSYKQTAIAKFQAACPPSEPLASLPRAKRDKTFVSIASKLATAASAG